MSSTFSVWCIGIILASSQYVVTYRPFEHHIPTRDENCRYTKNGDRNTNRSQTVVFDVYVPNSQAHKDSMDITLETFENTTEFSINFIGEQPITGRKINNIASFYYKVNFIANQVVNTMRTSGPWGKEIVHDERRYKHCNDLTDFDLAIGIYEDKIMTYGNRHFYSTLYYRQPLGTIKHIQMCGDIDMVNAFSFAFAGDSKI